jgi:hypothetical protein
MERFTEFETLTARMEYRDAANPMPINLVTNFLASHE